MSLLNRKDSLNRLAVFVEHFPPFLGSDRTMFELAKRVAEKGTKVHFIVTQPLRYLVGHRPEDWKYKENWKNSPPDVHENITARYLLVHRSIVGLWRKFPPLAYIITLFSFIFQSIREVGQFRPQVITAAHASPILGVVAVLTAKLNLRPIVMGCPDWMSAYAAELVQESITSLGPVLLQIAELLLYKVSDKIVVVTEFLKSLMTSLGIQSAKLVVIPNGIDPTQFRPDIDVSSIKTKYRLEDSIVILFSGHLEEWAGLSLLYNLAARLEQSDERAVILIVGAGDAMTELFDKLASNNLGHMIVYAGLHPFEDMPAFTAASDIALCIFPDSKVSHAASPLKLFEYMAAGKAIVATKVAGTAEVLSDETGILVPPGRIDLFSEAVVDLCKDKELRKKLGQGARNLAVSRYSWRNLSDEFLKVCEHAYAKALLT